MGGSDRAARSLAEECLGVPLVAGAFFHLRWHGGALGPPLVWLVESVAWLFTRWRHKLPASAYVAITQDHVAMLEYRFGPPRVAREVTRWRRHEGRGSVAEKNVYSVEVSVGGRTVELEAMTYDDDSAAVVAALAAS